MDKETLDNIKGFTYFVENILKVYELRKEIGDNEYLNEMEMDII